ncbi:MAG: hypothetical protein DMF73_00565 [Acidobacteria bacterium]|nr:MAG: hypothetical protein DMF73_00565 [Acidobacteriota bacterium]
MISIKLVERQPNDLFVDRLLQAPGKRKGNLFRSGATVTTSPDQRRSLVEAMSQITIEIVNEGFVRECLNDQPLLPGTRLSLAIGFHVIQF